jgi:hypothetical protein
MKLLQYRLMYVHCLSWFVVCCVGSGLCEGLSLVQRIPTGCVCLNVCNLATSKMRPPRLELGCCSEEEKLVVVLFTVRGFLE